MNLSPETEIKPTMQTQNIDINKKGEVIAIDQKQMTRAEKNRLNGKLGGRPKGKKLARTIDKEKVQKHLEAFYQKRALQIARASLGPALGQMFIYKIEEEVTGHGPKGGEYVKRKHTLVDNPKEIERALNVMEGGGSGTDHENENTYYYVTTKEPDSNAIDKIFNRAFGKPKETVDTNINVQFSLRTLGARREALKQGEVEIISPRKNESTD